jgi:hypothetical protein
MPPGRLHRLEHGILPPLHQVGAGSQILVKRESGDRSTAMGDEVIYLRDYQRSRDAILVGTLYPLTDPLVIVVPAVHESDRHRGVEHDRQLLAETRLDQVAIRFHPKIPRTLENTSCHGTGPLDHRGSENAAHQLRFGDPFRSSPPGECPVNLRVDV